jgi:hypothetical protein
MYRIDNATSVLHASGVPAPAAVGVNVDGYFTKGNPGGGIPATIVDDDWANAVQEEIANAIEGSGQTLNKTVRTQLRAAFAYFGAYRNRAIYTLVAGVQNVSINGAANTTVGAGTFTWPASGAAKVTVVGAGGSGGSTGTAASQSGGGGGAGGAAIRWISGQTPATTTAVTVGLGGPSAAAGGGANGTNGTTGGTSSFGAFCSTTGGSFGTGAAATVTSGGGGGIATGGDLNFGGGAPSDGVPLSGGGNGGNSIFGGAGRSSIAASPVQNGVAPGGGGGAAYAVASIASGVGANGIVILEY